MIALPDALRRDGGPNRITGPNTQNLARLLDPVIQHDITQLTTHPPRGRETPYPHNPLNDHVIGNSFTRIMDAIETASQRTRFRATTTTRINLTNNEAF